MVQRLAQALEIPVRERNQLLKAAGFAGTYPEQRLDQRSLQPYLSAIKYTMSSHAPYPAVLKNRYHEILDMNEPAQRLFSMLDPSGPQKSMVEWVLEPGSTASVVLENYETIAWSMIFRIRGEAAENPNDKRMQELAAYAEGRAKELPAKAPCCGEFVTCPTMKFSGHRISLVGVVARFGSAQEATLDNLRVELMHPRDELTAKFFQELEQRPPLRIAR